MPLDTLGRLSRLFDCEIGGGEMKKRWTMEDLTKRDDIDCLQCLVAERLSELNPYAPLAKRLSAIYHKLDGREIQEAAKKVAT
jgi:hypothetical protein